MWDFRAAAIAECNLYIDRFDRALERVESTADGESKKTATTRVWYRHANDMNSIGNLVLHITGNFHHYIGMHVGGIVFERNRHAEFETIDGVSIADLRSELREARELFQQVINDATDDHLDAKPDTDGYETRRGLIMHVVGHAGYHAGQAVLLSKLISGDTGRVLDWGH